ncbi:MAG: GntR family transcriptional regulator [Chitinivibrionales bacterium]|nr:GntR family transcriptional regulator [Chitinivibrionales bacterium]
MSRSPEPSRRARAVLSKHLYRPFPGAPLPALPPIATLAREAEVAYKTMWKAVSEYRRHGLVDVKPHVGITARTEPLDLPLPETDPPPAQPRAAAIADAIERDLVTGGYDPGKLLPSAKELCARYRTSYRTVRAALSRLVADGAIVRDGRGYAVTPPRRFGAGATVVLVARGDDLGRLNMLTPRSNVLLRALEEGCIRADLSLTVHTHNYRGSQWQGIDALRRVVRGRERTGPVVGSIVWDVGLNMLLLNRILPILADGGRPVAVLDEVGMAPRILAGLSGRLTRVFSMATSTRDGARVARRLHALGHRHVAYFGLRHVAPGADARLRGLRETMGRFGRECVVTDARESGKTWDEVTRTRDTELVDRASRALEADSDLYGIPSRRAVQDVALALGQVEILRRVERALTDRFERELRRGRATAWVAYNDSIALAILEFLRRRGVAVPGRVSVIGFDNGQQALARDLTSFDFGCVMYANAMLGFIRNPSSRHFQGRHTVPVAYDGFLVERGSSDTAPRHE